MQHLLDIGHWLMGPGGAVLFAVLYGISESLASIPSVQANSTFQLVKGWLKRAKDANPEQPVEPKQ